MEEGVFIEFLGETNAGKHHRSRSANVYEARPVPIGRKAGLPDYVYLVWLPVAWVKLLFSSTRGCVQLFQFLSELVYSITILMSSASSSSGLETL